MSEQSEGKNQKLVLLAVLAHPDDETFGMGGTLAFYAARGVDVHLVCATRGEVGEMEEEYLRGFNSVGERRVAELHCAAEKLGLKAVHFLDYRDSGMPGTADNTHPQALIVAPMEKVSDEIFQFMKMLKPQVILTFDPIGGYRHPDHIAIHNATVMAFQKAVNANQQGTIPAYLPQKLYFHTMPNLALKIMVRLMPLVGKDPRKFGKNADIDLASITEVSFPTHAVIQFRSVAELREKASACHASQGGHKMARGPFGLLRRLFGTRETFMRAYPEPDSKKKEYDLFECVVA